MNPAWSIGLWPSLGNPAWRRADAANAMLGSSLAVAVRPSSVRRKLDPAAMAPLKGRFLVPDLGTLPAQPINELYTYGDMADVAEHGENLAETRLYRWLMASWAAGRAVQGRGQVFDTEEKIRAYCKSNLDLLRSLQRDGYNYAGDDEICLGITGAGEILHMRRGTHRMAAAQILELPSVTGRITHVDQRFAETAVTDARQRGESGSVATILGQAIQKITRHTLA
jgi:hypothetical protein